MKARFHLLISALLSGILSALTLPMLLLAQIIDASYDYGTKTSAVIRFLWSWGIDLTNGTKQSEPKAELRMYTINFCFFFFILLVVYFGAFSFAKQFSNRSPKGGDQIPA